MGVQRGKAPLAGCRDRVPAGVWGKVPQSWRKVNMNIDKAEKAMREFLEALDIDLKKHNMEKTPKRVAKMYSELFNGVNKNTEDIWGETFTGGSFLVAVTNLPFYSICEHHLVPFFGDVDIVYLPRNGKIAGFSKFAKLVDILSHRPQLQENLTEEIADAVYKELDAKGALVVVTAKQLCMTLAGESLLNSKTATSATKGEFTDNDALLKEAWRLINKEKV